MGVQRARRLGGQEEQVVQVVQQWCKWCNMPKQENVLTNAAREKLHAKGRMVQWSEYSYDGKGPLGEVRGLRAVRALCALLRRETPWPPPGR